MDRRAIAAAITPFALMACSGSASRHDVVNREHGIPIRASEIRGPGTALGDGFTVPKGAVLAGPVLSTTNSANNGHVRSWSATLGIDGPPIEVMQTLADQARAIGLDQASDDGRCGSPRVPASQPSFCRTRSTPLVRGQPWARQSFSVEVAQTAAPTTVGFVTYQDLAVGPEITFLLGSQTAAPLELALAPLPAQRRVAHGRLLHEGEEIALGVPVLPGTAAVTPVFRSWTGKNEVVLRVTDDPNAVFRRYVRFLERWFGGISRSPNNRSGPWSVKYAYFEEGIEDGEGGTVHLFTERGRSYIRLVLHPSA